MSDTPNYMPLGDLLESLSTEGFLFRTQGVDGDEYVPAEEVASDLRHGDMAEMLTWPAVWNGGTQTVAVIAPANAVESPGALVEFHALHTPLTP